MKTYLRVAGAHRATLWHSNHIVAFDKTHDPKTSEKTKSN